MHHLGEQVNDGEDGVLAVHCRESGDHPNGQPGPTRDWERLKSSCCRLIGQLGLGADVEDRDWALGPKEE